MFDKAWADLPAAGAEECEEEEGDDQDHEVLEIKEEPTPTASTPPDAAAAEAGPSRRAAENPAVADKDLRREQLIERLSFLRQGWAYSIVCIGIGGPPVLLFFPLSNPD